MAKRAPIAAAIATFLAHAVHIHEPTVLWSFIPVHCERLWRKQLAQRAGFHARCNLITVAYRRCA